MPLTLELPAQLEEDLKQEAEKEGVPATDHAALLLSIITALLRETEATPFRNALREFFSQHSLDAEQVALVLEELVEQCLQEDDKGKASATFQQKVGNAIPRQVYENLREWRNWQVHQPIDASLDQVTSPLPPPHRVIQREGRLVRKQTAMGKYAYVPGTSDDFAREKQEEIAREEGGG